MPWPSDLAAETLDLRARRWWRRLGHRHQPIVVLDEWRTEAVSPHVLFVQVARCGACTASVVRVKRYGPGSDGDTGWQVAP